jgi:hypothetical protein
VASQPSKDNIAETDAAVGAADHEEKNISCKQPILTYCK